MGGKSSSPKQQVAEYSMSLHVGVCALADEVKRVWYGERSIWRGRQRRNASIGVSREGLFGGVKKEGGVRGYIEFYMGGDTQQVSSGLAQRLGDTPERLPGYRGITSLFFRGTDGQPGGRVPVEPGENLWQWIANGSRIQRGFYFGANNPNLKPIWVTASRAPKIPVREGESPSANTIPRLGGDEPVSVYFTLDDSGSMAGSRLSAMKASVNGVVDELIARVQRGGRVDVGLAGMNRLRRETKYCSVSDLEGLKTLTNSITASGDTPFDRTSEWVRDWFIDASSDEGIVGMSHVLLSDGEATGDSAENASEILRPLIQRDYDVDMWGVCMDNPSAIANLELIQNMPEGVIIVDTNDTDAFVQALLDTLPVARDANPVAVIAECYINSDWGMGTSVDNIDWESFWDARDVVRDEGLGVFYQWHSSTTIEQFLDGVLETIKGAVFPHPRTGLLTMRLLREESDLDLREINPDNSQLDSFSRKLWGEITSEVVTTWTNPVSEKEETVTVHNLATSARQGATISSSFNAHGLRTRESAIAVGTRELALDSLPLISCEAVTDQSFWDVVPYDRLILSWPEHGISQMPVRVMQVSYGDSNSNSITLDLIEDIFSRNMTVYIDPSESMAEPPLRSPVPVVDPRIIEVPAFMASQNDVNVAAAQYPETAATVLATAPDSAASGFDLFAEVVEANGGTTWEELGSNEFIGAGFLTDPLIREVRSQGIVLDQSNMALSANNVLIIGNSDLPNEELELALILSISETGEAEILRGALDTTPREWDAGTLVWITSISDWEPVPSTLMDGQSVTVRLLTQATGGQLALESAPDETEVVNSRLTLPTRPAGLTANGNMWTTRDTDIGYPVELAWVSRNRLLEDSVMLAWDEAGLPPEEGTTYRVVVDGMNDDDTLNGQIAEIDTPDLTALLDETVMVGDYAASAYIRARVFAVRDELESWQAATLNLPGLLSPPTDLAAEYRPPLAPSDLAIELILE